jgi:hypothetical protein
VMFKLTNRCHGALFYLKVEDARDLEFHFRERRQSELNRVFMATAFMIPSDFISCGQFSESIACLRCYVVF